MDTQFSMALLTGLIGIISGVILTYLGTVLKFRKDLEAEYDKDLRNRRLDAYKDLWKHLQLLARYDRPKPLTCQTLEELSVAMRTWYFETGGLYLSEETRKSYFVLKKAIRDLIASGKYPAEKTLDGEDGKAMVEQASVLRARLTQDVGTRKSSPVADS